MYEDENWKALTDDEATEILETASPIDDKYETSATTTKVEKRSLPFYPDTPLIRLTDPSWDNAKLAFFYLLNDTTLYHLGRKSQLIHEVNATGALALNEENVLDYLRFFAFFVRSEEGPFVILENFANPALPPNMDQNSRKIFEKYLRPAEIEGEDENGSFICNAPVLYANTLSIARFEVKRTGEIDLPKYEMVAADLPFTADMPIS